MKLTSQGNYAFDGEKDTLSEDSGFGYPEQTRPVLRFSILQSFSIERKKEGEKRSAAIRNQSSGTIKYR